MILFFKSMKGWGLIIMAISTMGANPVLAELWPLPNRESPVPLTTNSIPHIQIGVEAVPEISTELLRRVSKIVGVELRNTIVSLPGAMGFWLHGDLKLARPEVIIRGREFAHLHPDGSLHASLSPEMAAMAVKTKWAVYHPWSKQRPGLAGFVMIYTPKSKEEMEVVFDLIMESYRFVTGIERL